MSSPLEFNVAESLKETGLECLKYCLKEEFPMLSICLCHALTYKFVTVSISFSVTSFFEYSRLFFKGPDPR